ncbi:MAG: protein kinase [Clostridiales bacterium]|nr:protein kinase [Clostridiales bacterium]
MARIRTNKNICLSCFGDLDSNRVCMNCHHKADDTPSPPHHLPQRTVIGSQNRYLVGKALGEGGFGITYLAWDLQQGIKVALKEYFPSGYVTRVAGNNQVIINSKQNQAASNRGLKRFVEEARALAKIKNLAGVVNVRDFFSANGTAYIVMEFLDGVSLKKYLQRKGGKISIDEVLTIMRPVMDSLTQVHKTGLIHRDISPDNILITKYNEVKLIDFGAAKYSNPDGRSLSIVLKQGFAPPEQYDTHGDQGPWTDVYALGVTIYYAITGVLPPESIRVVMGKESIKRPSELGIQIDAGVENALMKSLAVDKKKRYQDVQSMINGLYNPHAPRRTVNVNLNVSTTPTPSPTAPQKTVVTRAVTPAAAAPRTTAIGARTQVKQSEADATSSTASKSTVKQTITITRSKPEEKVPDKSVTAKQTVTAKPSAPEKQTVTAKQSAAVKQPATAKPSATEKQTVTAKPTVSVQKPAATQTTASKPAATRTQTVTASRVQTVTPLAKSAAAKSTATPTPASKAALDKPAKPDKADKLDKADKKADETKQISTTNTKNGNLFSKLFKK